MCTGQTFRTGVKSKSYVLEGKERSLLDKIIRLRAIKLNILPYQGIPSLPLVMHIYDYNLLERNHLSGSVCLLHRAQSGVRRHF